MLNIIIGSIVIFFFFKCLVSMDTTNQGVKRGPLITRETKPEDIHYDDETSGSKKTYTASQLFEFHTKNKFPAVGSPETITKKIDFNNCKKSVDNTISSFRNAVPTEVILENKLIYMAKVWSNESEMLFTCSNPDKKLTIVISPYL